MPGTTIAKQVFDTVAVRDASGRLGTVNTSDTVAVPAPTQGEFSAIQIINDTVFAALTEPSATGSLVGKTIPAGMVLYGSFTGYQLTSGVVRAYV